MTAETLSASTTIQAPLAAVFAVLADPASHAAIDGTGWVSEAIDSAPLTASGQVFRMRMYHRNHPDGHYEIANQVRVFDPPRAILWAPGTEDDGGELSFGGWVWAYDLSPGEDGATDVRLTYDWSGAEPQAREVIQFPPFEIDHLENSLSHLAELATSTSADLVR